MAIRNLNAKEQEAIDLTVQLWNAIIELDVLHPMENQEHCRDIHNIQNRLQSRVFLSEKSEPCQKTWNEINLGA
jgi:hypothetical protein